MLKTIAVAAVGLMCLEMLIALIASHGLNGHIYREEKSLDVILRRMSVESPKAFLVVKICYSLIFLEFCVILFAKIIGVK